MLVAVSGECTSCIELVPVGRVVAVQRSARLMGFTVRMAVKAGANDASRWWMQRSVLRRSCPKFDNQLSMGLAASFPWGPIPTSHPDENTETQPLAVRSDRNSRSPRGYLPVKIG